MNIFGLSFVFILFLLSLESLKDPFSAFLSSTGFERCYLVVIVPILPELAFFVFVVFALIFIFCSIFDSVQYSLNLFL